MSSTYSATALQDAIYKAKQSEMFQSWETRKSNYGALDAAIAQRNLLLPNSVIEDMKKASTQATKVDVFVKEAAGAGTARKCEGTGAGATASQTLSWTTIVEEFAISYLDLAANRYSWEEMFQRRLQEKLKALYVRIDEYVVAQLEAAYTAGDGTNFVKFNDASQVPADDYDLQTSRAAMWLNKAKSDMFANDANMDNLHMVGEGGLLAIVNSMANQGQYTETNLGYQFQNVGFSHTNRVINNTGRYATGYLFEKGMFTLLTWTNALHRKGEDIGTDVWTIFQDPRYGFDIELKVKKQCKDNSSILSGLNADYQEGFVLSVDICVPTAYTSDTNSGIYKYEFDVDNTVQSGSGSYS